MSKKTDTAEDAEKNTPSQVEETPVAETPEGAPTENAAETETAAPGESAESAEAERQEQEDFRDQYLRLRADFENFRKRTRKEKEEWTQRSLDHLCSDLLKVLDSFDLGIENSRGKEFTADTLKGFEMVRGQLFSTLGTYGLKEVKVENEVFDPTVHEAITHIPSPEVEEGAIVAVTRKGYQLGNRLLRPVQVVVSAGSPDETPESETTVPEGEN